MKPETCLTMRSNETNAAPAIGPDAIINHLTELTKETRHHDGPSLPEPTPAKLTEENLFPLDVFPNVIQEIIRSTNEALNFPIDFIGSSLLFAASVAIGNSTRVKFKNGFKQPGILYLALVGPPGTNKTHPLNWALEPLQKLDSENYQKYQREIKEFEQTRKDQEGPPGVKPYWIQSIIKDFTPEALTLAHERNKRGLGVHADELAGWLGNFQRYNKGSEQEFWLSAWNGSDLSFIRKTSDPVYLERPFISVAGTIQPGILDRMAKGRTENGFLDRFLFSMPDGLMMHLLNDKNLTNEIPEAWESIIKQLSELPFEDDPRIIELSDEARRQFMKWNAIKTKEGNESDDQELMSILSKMTLYCLRFALILELLNFATGRTRGETITLESMTGAIKLTEHFTTNANKINSIITGFDPLENLTPRKKELYNNLPDQFTTKEGLEIAGKLNFPVRTFERFLSKEKNLFMKVSRGNYQKL